MMQNYDMMIQEKAERVFTVMEKQSISRGCRAYPRSL